MHIECEIDGHDFLDGINKIIQRQLSTSDSDRQIHLRAAEDMSVRFVVDEQIYHEISQIEEVPIREFIQAVILKWEKIPTSSPATANEFSALQQKILNVAESIIHDRDVNKDEVAELRREVQEAIDPARIIAARHQGNGGDYVSAWIKEIMTLSFLQRQVYGVLLLIGFPFFPIVFGG